MAVGFGAYAAHGFPDAPEAAQWVDKASRYQMYHALALLALAGLQRGDGRLACLAGILFVAGTLLFCGALYGLALTSLPVAWVAPFGGSAFILGWLALAAAAILEKRQRE
ncbi:DUF423 domain-containing protein [Telmatospirillum sp.]|uniref:DUF423 domain-containing protein n=1 Tax=Telmatospirillum sp. TaxID=2079197 RepID=UPI0028460DF6|nr:DUF423 domain-containing protein [Telmatospirillum sp.]MDR3441368.1 DUF423 domain-containing protein [Telmatospirillum sp.]